MIYLLVIFGILIIISSGYCVISANNPEEIVCIITAIVFSIFFGIASYDIKKSDNPQAIDVYRGKTTLQVTYQDSIAIDSVVVYKKIN